MITSTLASGDPISRNFLNTKVSEIYVFDPPEASGDADLHSVASWKNASSSVGTKVVRAYVHKLYPTGFQDLFGAAAAAIQSDTPAFLETPSGEASLVYLPIGADPTSNIWTRSCNAVTALLSGIPGVPQCQCASWSFEKVHHTIPALFLTDAARRSKL